MAKETLIQKLEKLLDLVHQQIDKFFDWLFSYQEEKPEVEENTDPSFYERERNYHEQAIMEINDEILFLEEQRAKHEYFFNISDTMYSKLVQKENI